MNTPLQFVLHAANIANDIQQNGFDNLRKEDDPTLWAPLDYRLFQQTWSSTALGFGGIGGQAITSAYTCVVINHLVMQARVYFNGRFAYQAPVGKTFYEDLRAQSLKSVKDSIVYMNEEPYGLI